MAKRQTDVDCVENIGAFERVNRLILALGAIMVAVVLTVIPEMAVVALVAIGIYSGLTAFLGWDPLYGLAKSLLRQPPAPTPATTTASGAQCREEPSLAGRYDKAA
jgi:hypothetical protein